MSTPKEKNILSLWFYPDTIELMRRYKEKEGYKTLSMFAEKAIRFYCGYLSSDEKKIFEKLGESKNMKPNASAAKNFFNRFRNLFE